MTPDSDDMANVKIEVVRVSGVASIEITGGPSDGQLGTVLKLYHLESQETFFYAIPEHDSLFLCEAIPGALRQLKQIIYQRENPDEFPNAPETPQGSPIRAGKIRGEDARAIGRSQETGVQNPGSGPSRLAQAQEAIRRGAEASRERSCRVRESLWFTFVTAAALILGLSLSQTVRNILVNFLHGMVQ